MWTDFNDDLEKKLTDILAAGISEDTMKPVKKHTDAIMESIEDDLMYRLKDELAPNLAAFVKDMAERTVQALLDGNEKLMRQYLSCSEYGYNGRSDGYHANRDIAEQHSIIHGNLHSASCIELRQKIVEAHRELITSERIKDLEDQVSSLIAQHNNIKAERDRARQELGNYRKMDE